MKVVVDFSQTVLDHKKMMGTLVAFFGKDLGENMYGKKIGKIIAIVPMADSIRATVRIFKKYEKQFSRLFK